MKQPQEYRITSLRECPTLAEMAICQSPDKAAAYWDMHIATAPGFNPDVETAVVLLLNTRMKIKGHHIVSVGTLDSCTLHPREVFRAAFIAAAKSVVLIHNHPSGDPSPSEADIRVTKELVRAGLLLKIELTDSIVVGDPGKFTSLRELGHFQ